MKVTSIFVFVALFLLSWAAAGAAEEEKAFVFEPLIIDNRLCVPLRESCEALGIAISQIEKAIILQKAGKALPLREEKRIGETTLIPAKNLAEDFGLVLILDQDRLIIGEIVWQLGQEQHIFISLDEQRLTAYAGIKPVMSFPISAAESRLRIKKGDKAPMTTVIRKDKKAKTEMIHDQVGTFEITGKYTGLYSYQFDVPLQYCLTYWENHMLHLRPEGTEEQIGQPASHGCIRMPKAHAKKLWDWAHIGDELTIY